VFRYVAFVWDDADSAARASADALTQRLARHAPDLSAVLSRNGLRVFCAGVRAGSSEPYQLSDGAGVVLGKLFERRAAATSASAPLALADDECRKIVSSGGRRLIERYWGRYVAFIYNEAARVTRVLVDPTATLPCFVARFGSVEAYFSRMEDVEQLGSHAFSVNWKYVAAMLCQVQLQVPSTGLNEVSRVLGGECVEHREGRSARSFYWTQPRPQPPCARSPGTACMPGRLHIEASCTCCRAAWIRRLSSPASRMRRCGHRWPVSTTFRLAATLTSVATRRSLPAVRAAKS
jgi:asparagine synthase (glutamine-hydrolysing)